MSLTASLRRLLAPLGAAAVLAALPAGAAARTTWFGSRLNHEPANAGNSCADDDPGLMGFSLCTHVGSFYPGTSGRARSPVTGRVIRFRVRAEGPATLTFRLVRVRNVSANHKQGQAKAVARGRTVKVKGPNQTQLDDGTFPVESFKANLFVRKGWELAVDARHNTAEYCSDGTPGQLLFGPTLTTSSGFHHSKGVDGCLLLVQAVVRH